MFRLNTSALYNGILAAFYLAVEGVVGSMFYYGALPLFFYYYEVSVLDYQKVLTVGMLPWSCKPFPAVISELYPIRGKHKQWYASITASAVPFFIVGVVLSSKSTDAMIFFTIMSTLVMIINTLFEGQYATKIKFEGASNNLAPFTRWLVMVGSIVGVIVVGALADNESDAHRVIYGYIGCIPLTLPLIYLLFKYPNVAFSNDETGTDADIRQLLNEEAHTERRMIRSPPSREECVLAGCMVFTAILLLGIMYNVTHDNIYTSFGIAVTMTIALVSYTFRVYRATPHLAGICAFSFLHEILYVDITAAMDVFYTAPDVCIVDGPDFDLLFYTSWTKIIAHVIAAFAMLGYMRWVTQWRCRTAVITGVTLRIFSSITDVVIAKRWNKTALDVNDKTAYVFGDAMLSPAAQTFIQISLVIVSTSVLIKGREALTQAVISALQAMGQTVSRIFGMVLIQAFGITANMKTGYCNYDNYTELLIVSHMVIPMFLYPLSFMLLR